jgi:hypothetical protein
MGCGTDASDGSGVAVGYKANGVGRVGGVYVISDAVAVGAGDIISGGAGTSVFMC